LSTNNLYIYLRLTNFLQIETKTLILILKIKNKVENKLETADKNKLKNKFENFDKNKDKKDKNKNINSNNNNNLRTEQFLLLKSNLLIDRDFCFF